MSMGMNTALKNAQIVDNANGVLGIELMGAAQALDLRDFQPGTGCDTARAVIREKVDFLDIDRSLAPDHTAMQELTGSCRILEKVEKVVGDLAVGE